MLNSSAIRLVSLLALALLLVPSLSLGQAKPGQAPSQVAEGGVVIQVRAKAGEFLPQRVREQIRGVANVAHTLSFLEGKTTDGVRVIGLAPGPILYLPSGKEARVAAVVQGRGLEPGDAPEAMVVGKTFAQHNKTALGLSIPAMLTRDHFPPIVVGGQGFAIVGIYATGDLKTDDQVLMLLGTAQKLLNQPGRLSGISVALTSPAAAEQVAKDLRRILGDAVEVTPATGRQR